MYILSWVFLGIGLWKQRPVIPKAGDEILECASHSTIILCVAILEFQACLDCKICDLINADFDWRHDALLKRTDQAQTTAQVHVRLSYSIWIEKTIRWQRFP